MSSSSISWTKAELPFTVQKLPAKHVIDCSIKPADCLSLPKSSCAVFISSEMCSICFHPTIRCMHEYLKPSWWAAPNYIYYGIFFPHWNGALGRKSSVLLSLPCSAEQAGAYQGCVKNAGPDMDRQLPLQPEANMTDTFISCISPSPGERAGPFSAASTYSRLHVQLLGGFWSRQSHPRTDFASVESRTKLYSTLTEAEASSDSLSTHGFF